LRIFSRIRAKVSGDKPVKRRSAPKVPARSPERGATVALQAAGRGARAFARELAF